jgi:hypothetical protein
MPFTEPADDLLRFEDTAAASRLASFGAALFAFLCFMPYPAITVGNYSALQLGNLATIVALFCTSVAIWGRITVGSVFLVIMPRFVSTLKVLVLDNRDASTCMNSTIFWAVTLLTLVAFQAHARRHALAMFTGIAIAMLVHAAIGAYQIYSFSFGVMPLLDLYVNASFMSVQDNAISMARYEQRPFGLFPEPSAMSSSLGPFVILFTAICLDVVKLRQPLGRWHRWLFASASAGALGLIIASQSGHAVPTAAAVGFVLMLWLFQARATIGNYLLIACSLGGVVPIVGYFALNALNARVGGRVSMGNESWEERYTSIVTGFKIWSHGGLSTILLGLGPGLSGEYVKESTNIVAVFSIALTWIYDTGLLGLVALIWVARQLRRTWEESSHDLVYIVMLLNWLLAVTVTTSYGQLLPLWIALGIVSSWSEIFQIPVLAKLANIPDPHLRRAARRARMSPWNAEPSATHA